MGKTKISDMTPGELLAHQKKQEKVFKDEHGYTRDEETNKQRFNRVYGTRLRKVIKGIDTLGNCSGVGYDYDIKVVETATQYLHNKIDDVKSQFTPKTETEDNTSSEIGDILAGRLLVEKEPTEEDQ